MLIVTISHLINVLVAGSIGTLLLLNLPSMTAVYGEVTPARSILASVYLAIAATSLFALIFPAYSIAVAKVLFPVQILYKVSTVLTVGTITHPVVISNLFISILHAISLLMIFK
jgi:hypothetical protein